MERTNIITMYMMFKWSFYPMHYQMLNGDRLLIEGVSYEQD